MDSVTDNAHLEDDGEQVEGRSAKGDEQEDAYRVGRGLRPAGRFILTCQHYLMKDQHGWLLHPKIAFEQLVKDNEGGEVLIADVGTGNGVWPIDLASSLPLYPKTDVQIHGLDISAAQFAHPSSLPDKVTLSVLDILSPVPEALREKYHVVHIRYFCLVATDENVPVILKHASAMLKPGGYLHWTERDYYSHQPHPSSPAPNPTSSYNPPAPWASITQYMRARYPSISWIPNLSTFLTKAGLDVIVAGSNGPPLRLRHAWIENALGAWADFAESIDDEGERRLFRQWVGEAWKEGLRGWAPRWEVVDVVGRKVG
ncbi:hypothetical protein MMC28_007947 [Mycoblastus sanguinarius]|nr:hypothetical protein [Mycoblastus sanguinarius]